MSQQLSICDIMRQSGGTWIEFPGNFTKHVNDQEIQIYLSLSPTGDQLAICSCFPEGIMSKTFNLPSDMTIPRNFSMDYIEARMRSYQPDVKSAIIYKVKNQLQNFAIGINLSAKKFFVFGYSEDGENFETLDIM